jgi:hypothetical protein
MSSQIAKQRHKNIMHWDDERALGNSLIVSLIHGKQFSADIGTGEHVRGFDTVKEAMSEVRSAVDCDCNDCKKHLSEAFIKNIVNNKEN